MVLVLLFTSSFLFGQSALKENQQPQKRLALVIGNGNYLGSTLANPENDAKAMANVLKRLGFEVEEYEDLSQSKMKKAIDEFGAKLKGKDVGLFYYAGHGIQSNGINYLIPVDAELSFEKQVEYDCVQLDRILAFMEESETKTNIIILDACRNNPFEKNWSRSIGEKGLAFMNAPKGSFIAYATSPGSTASDGGGRNGLYTSAILESIIAPDLTINQIFQKVRTIVIQKSNQQQTPWDASSLTGDFYFIPGNNAGEPQTEQQPVQLIPVINAPAVSNPAILNKTATGASMKASVTDDGGASVVARGICYGNTTDLNVSSLKTIEGSGTGEFTSTVGGLSPGKTYYARTYAINSAGTTYSSQVSFRTDPAKPVITAPKISFITSVSALSNGSISDDGGSKILARGFCWDTLANPTIKNKRTENGEGTGSFKCNIADLIPGMTYYIRAYSTNDEETSYGNETEFKTLYERQVIDIDENVYNTIQIFSQLWMQENLKTTRFNDGTPIQEIIDKIAWRNKESPSYCWYDNQEAYKTTYGALYNFKAVNEAKLCPVGWHVPSVFDWEILINALQGKDNAGGYLKEHNFTYWGKTNVTPSYDPLFLALPGGFRDDTGNFQEIGTTGIWWSSYDSGKSTFWYMQMSSSYQSVVKKKINESASGFSVRCVKDY
jgi:uncharacterized protein (TIGR02145 family)